MSKVVHLTDDAHNKAKDYCKERGLRMSDWVANLIETAIAGDQPLPLPDRPGVMPVAKRRDLRRHDENAGRGDVEAVYAAPPFWAARASSGG